MDDINKRLDDWNRSLAEGEKLRLQMKRDAIRMKDGPLRRITVWSARFLDRWIERGKRWRDDDIMGD